ncbi:hypothetical protein B7P43_G10959 [Cryptotermes secundus]|uniref:Ubinuclein-1 n=1 Tax=Cryptotermes secundus TaxID=105785 RepID=A0A2J7R5N4_9NEOP|nr:ubinuclein-1 isoform X2 [Cryptotermes secundus]PNF36146.1 hypothetical protein B7P43_G10959 [Cryptotermes secundus]
MSEPKRNTLTSLSTNKKEKKSKELLKTVRFTLGLPESNEEACPEFHYSALLNSAERKRKAKLKSDGQVNGVDPLAEDDDDRLKEIARQFEEKYGGAGKKKHGRYEDYVDLGAGYDETDPFIDNTDAYDEVVPEEMTTAHGGFYINCGALEFKEISDQSDAEELKELKTKKRLKRSLILPEEEVDEEGRKVANSVQIKKPKLQAVEQKDELLKKRKLLSHDREILKKKKKRAIDDLVKKKSVTVKDLLREKRESLELGTASGVQLSPEQKKSAALNPASVTKPCNTSITDIIESVVSAAREDDTSKDSGSSISKSGSLITTDSEDSQDVEDKEKASANEEVKLPDHLQEDLKELLVALKRRAAESSAEGKCKFFSTEVNNMLLKVEHKCRALPCSGRQAVYGHLAAYLPCTKDTLIKRAKKLLIKTEEDKIYEPMTKLKSVIDRMMPSVLENFSKECQRVADEKSIEELPSPSSDSEFGEGENKTAIQKSKVPRRKFPFTHEVRSLLCEVVRIKLQCLELAKSRKESADLNLRNFLETEVKPLWQPGWMKVSTLLRETREVHANAVLKPKKSAPVKKLAAMPPLSHGPATNVAMQSITAFSQSSTANSNARMKTSPPVSITMTPVPLASGAGTSTSQVPNTAKMKSAVTSEASSVFPHGVSSNVTMRTKCSTVSSQNVNSQLHLVCSSVPALSSVSPSYITSNVRNSPAVTNSTKLSSLQLATSPSVPSRNKTGSDVKVAKFSSSSGKNSPSFQSEKQLPLPSVKQKLTVDRISPKTLDLSTSSVSRPVTVSSIMSSPSKPKSNPVELVASSGGVQKSVAMTSLPLMNIPDCISVTPSLSSPSLASVTSSASPPIMTPSKSMMSLKQRILHDTSLDRPSIIKASPVSAVVKVEDDGIEVIKIVKDARKAEGSKPTIKPVGKSENVTQLKTEVRKKKTEVPKDQVSPVTATIRTPLEQQSASVISSATPCHQEKEVERLLKEEEETAAAADFLSQINESLKNFPNSATTAGSRDVYHHEDRLMSCDQENSVYVSPKIDCLLPPSGLSPSSDQRGSASHGGEEKDKSNNMKGTDLKKEVEQTTVQGDEESVQMEVDRVMKELIELQGHFNTKKSLDTVDLEYSSTKAKVPPVTTNCSSVSVTVSVPSRMQQSKPSKLHSENPAPASGRRPSTGSTDLSKLSYGFQDEFQKHLFQETVSKQELEVPNSYKPARSKGSMAYSEGNQAAVHSAISGKHNQNSSLEGCVAGSQSRSCSNTNSATHYPKLMSVNMDSFTGPPYVNRMPTSLSSFLQDTSNAHMPQSGSNQHSPPY